jgi:hypothetical protein
MRSRLSWVRIDAPLPSSVSSQVSQVPHGSARRRSCGPCRRGCRSSRGTPRRGGRSHGGGAAAGVRSYAGSVNLPAKPATSWLHTSLTRPRGCRRSRTRNAAMPARSESRWFRCLGHARARNRRAGTTHDDHSRRGNERWPNKTSDRFRSLPLSGSTHRFGKITYVHRWQNMVGGTRIRTPLSRAAPRVMERTLDIAAA